jgi:hypothetical protein
MFFEEVKRTEGSHDEKKHRRRPPERDDRALGRAPTYNLVPERHEDLVDVGLELI